ncbi:MAG: hypothetical protein ABI220_01485 [Candidatus Saccharimonadales bacterium]
MADFRPESQNISEDLSAITNLLGVIATIHTTLLTESWLGLEAIKLGHYTLEDLTAQSIGPNAVIRVGHLNSTSCRTGTDTTTQSHVVLYDNVGLRDLSTTTYILRPDQPVIETTRDNKRFRTISPHSDVKGWVRLMNAIESLSTITPKSR